MIDQIMRFLAAWAWVVCVLAIIGYVGFMVWLANHV